MDQENTLDKQKEEVESRKKRKIVKAGKRALFINKVINFALYVGSFITILLVFNIKDLRNHPLDILSLGAIMAGFGSAIMAFSGLWEKDNLERVKENVGILYHDILKVKIAWKRWPFISRFEKKALFSSDMVLELPLRNPRLPLDVGTHIFAVDVPTVLQDFYDLPLLSNLLPLIRFRKSAINFFVRFMHEIPEIREEQDESIKEDKDEINILENLDPADRLMMYKCLLDIWRTVFIFRLSRYIVHFGSGIVLSSVIYVIWHLLV